MTENQLRLLREVAGGRGTFRCANASPDRLDEFERVADDPLKMERSATSRGARH